MKKILYSLFVFMCFCSLVFAATTTTHYGLYKPAQGDKNWATSVNNNFDTIDTAVYGKADTSTVNASLALKVNTSSVGVANGVASLGSDGLIPSGQLPSSIVGSVIYKGTLDASGAVYPSDPTNGDYYVISVAGTIDGTAYGVADWAVFNGTSWDKIDNSASSTGWTLDTGKVYLATGSNNVGINSTTPRAKLDVGGALYVSGGITGSLTGNASTATTAGTVTTAAQPAITSVGTLTSLGVTGTVTAGSFVGDGSGLTGISGTAPNPTTTNTWKQKFFGGASCFTNIMYGATENEVYATADVGGMFKSINAGDTWNHVGRDFPCVEVEQLIYAPSNPNYIYAACGNSSYNAGYTGVFASHDKGATWSSSSTTTTWSYKRPTHYKPIAVDHTNPLIVYAATPIISGHNYIYKSVNGGTSWTLFDTDPFSTEIKNLLISSDSKWLYATTSASSGANTRVYDLENDTDEAYTLTGTLATYNDDIASYKIGETETVCVAAGLKLACSSNGMATIAYSAEAHATKRIKNFDIAVDGTDVWIVATPWSTRYAKPIFSFSKDGGANWTSPTHTVTYDLVADPTTASTDAKYDSEYNTIKINPFNHSQILGGNWWGIWRTDNWGEAVTNKDTGASNIVMSDLVISPNGILFASGMDAGINKSTDGTSWQNVVGSNATYNYESSAAANWAGHYWRMAFAGEDETTAASWNAGTGIMIATMTGWNVDASAQVNYIIRSTDSGATWAKISGYSLPTAGESVGKDGISYSRMLDVCPSNKDVVAVGIEGTNGGIWISADAGATWTKTAFSTTSKTMVRGLAFDPTDSTCQKMAVGRWGDTGVRVTTDRFATAATTWNSQISDLKYRPGTSSWYATGSDGKLYLGGSSIHTFTDTEGNAAVASTITFDPNDSKIAYVSTDYPSKANALYMTTDITQGVSAVWTDITYDLAARQGAAVILKDYTLSNAGNLFIGTKGNGVWKLGTTSSSWETLGDNVYVTNGSVGIGTTSPSAALEVASTRTPVALTLPDGENKTVWSAPVIAGGWSFTTYAERIITGSVTPSAGYHNGAGWFRAIDTVDNNSDMFGLEGRIDSGSDAAISNNALVAYATWKDPVVGNTTVNASATNGLAVMRLITANNGSTPRLEGNSAGVSISDIVGGANNWAIFVADQTGATNDYGVVLNGADTQALWFNNDSGTANDGIAFGASRDTNLYRSGASQLTTDDAIYGKMGLSTDQNEVINIDIIKHTLTATDILNTYFVESWGKTSADKVNALSVSFYDSGAGTATNSFDTCTFNDGSDYIACSNGASDFSEGKIATIKVMYQK